MSWLVIDKQWRSTGQLMVRQEAFISSYLSNPEPRNHRSPEATTRPQALTPHGRPLRYRPGFPYIWFPSQPSPDIPTPSQHRPSPTLLFTLER